jgi:OOP family OmpA-OmpF porin
MNRFILVSFILLTTFGLTAQGNNPNSYNALSARVFGVDHGIPNEDLTDVSRTFALELGYRRQFGKLFGVAIPIKLATIDVGALENISTFGIDILPTFFPFGTEGKLSPYLHTGYGIVAEGLEEANHQIPVGGGINVKIGDNSWFGIQAEYRISDQDLRDNVMAGIGYTYRLSSIDSDGDGVVNRDDECPGTPGSAATNGCPDTDMDGILDADDKCPTLPGSANLAGCPDTDSDGTPDPDDKCPEVAGSASLMGCPDRDEDGVIDGEDKCPDVAGTVALMGCPDKDSDGVADAEDKCPDQAGPARLQGCPDGDADGVPDDIDQCPNDYGPLPAGCPDGDKDGTPDKDDPCPNKAGTFGGCPDSDGDGIGDNEDKCPSQAGTIVNNGCPEIKKEVKERLEYAARAVQFETGSAKLKNISFAVLGEIAAIMRLYPDYNLMISGHTDDVGPEENNLSLSQQRAVTCRDFLAEQGISLGRVRSTGYGESQPKADNTTSAGRKENRRVEFELAPRME